MNGAAVTSVEVAPPVKPPNASPGVSNAVRLVAQNLAMCAQHKSGDVDSFFQLCITLSRGMDYAIANKQVPAQVSELPMIFKLVCQRRNECSLQAAIMVLMVTVKNACKAQWFSSQDSQELLALADEMVSFFCTPEGFSCEQANIVPTVSQIMSRYYPQLKLGHILASVAIKPGFEACAVDFHILKTVNRSATEKIRLLLAMKDNIDTSSCIINPPKVNILLNGLGLQGKIVGCMYQGPQLPTVVNHMLRYGTNLLQAIGHFDAHYIVLIAYMSVIRSSDLPAPHDYHQPPAAVVDSEAEIIEGPSKISLNCPISDFRRKLKQFTCLNSLKRIRQPVKGHLCKHLQCFDLSNYLEINFNRPSWRCPHCTRPVCYPDIRIDQKMVKILQDVGEGATSVLIHSDGSWEANSGSGNHNDESHAKVFEGLQPEQQEASDMETDASSVYDLTEGNDEMISLDADPPEDQKAVVQPDLHSNSIQTNLSTPPVAGDPSQAIQNSVNQAQGVPYSGPLGNSFGQADYNTRANPEATGVISPAPLFGHFIPSPVFNQQSSTPTSVHLPLNNNLWLQQLQQRQMMSNVPGGYAIPGNVSRTHVAAQARPVQTPSPNPLMSSRPPFMNTFPRNSSALPHHTSLSPPLIASTSSGSTRMDSLQQFLISQSLLQQSSTAQMRGSRAPVQITNNAFRATLPGFQAPHQQNPMYHIPHMDYTPPDFRATSQVPTAPGIMNTNVLAEHGPSSGGTVQRVSRTEDLLNVQQSDEQNWQPTGRMRGSLAGRAYNEARDQLMIRPTQQTTPPPNQNNAFSPHLQLLLANRNIHSSEPNPN